MVKQAMPLFYVITDIPILIQFVKIVDHKIICPWGKPMNVNFDVEHYTETNIKVEMDYITR